MLLIEAQNKLLSDTLKYTDSELYRFDIVDIQRQIMSNLGQEIHKKAMEAYFNSDVEAFHLHRDRFLAMLHDVDEMLRTRSEYSFDNWLDSARKWGTNEQEKNLLESDATSLVTLWGGQTGYIQFDYSWREWSGLIEKFYLPRWSKFYNHIEPYVSNPEKYSDNDIPMTNGRQAFFANDFYKELGEWEIQFTKTPNKARYPLTQGDEIQLAYKNHLKYSELAKEYYQ